MRKGGVTLVELVIVLLVISVTVALFFGLITEMVDMSLFLFGKKGSYQQAKEALAQMAEEVRYALRSGDLHNLGVATAGLWQSTPTYPCTSSRITFFPDPASDQPVPTRRIRFSWESYNRADLPVNWTHLLREEATDETMGTVTVLASVTDAAQGNFTVKYYDDDAADGLTGEIIPSIGGLSHGEARRLTRVVFLLRISHGGQPVTLSETIFIRQRGVPPMEPGAL